MVLQYMVVMHSKGDTLNTRKLGWYVMVDSPDQDQNSEHVSHPAPGVNKRQHVSQASSNRLFVMPSSRKEEIRLTGF